MTEAGSR